MSDIVHKICTEPGCNKHPSFNFENKKRGLYCKKHAKENMVDVLHKKCLDCKTQPTFNFENKKTGLYCKEHKKDGMIDIKNKKCLDCNKRPNFNFEDQEKGLYCKEHKKEGMIDITHKKCLDCGKQSTFNFENKKTGIYCFEHQKEGMIDVTHKKCLDCDKIPSFNFENKKISIYCKEHKKENMVNVYNKKCLDCNKQPTFNFENEKRGIYCKEHKKEEMVDVCNKKCLINMCQVRGTKKYEWYCFFCFINTFPDKPVTRNYKTKEKAVSDYIKEQFSDVTWVLDKKISDGCSKRRPDLLLDLGYQVIIIEIDENQHTSYEDICENKRIMIISQDLNFRPIIFIRFNPDDYTINDKKITSCWGPNGNGIMSVKKTKKKEWVTRLDKLKETVTYWINTPSEKPIEIDNLFFDEIN
jgi:hypothetical protein